MILLIVVWVKIRIFQNCPELRCHPKETQRIHGTTGIFYRSMNGWLAGKYTVLPNRFCGKGANCLIEQCSKPFWHSVKCWPIRIFFHGSLQSLYNWGEFHPLYNLTNQSFGARFEPKNVSKMTSHRAPLQQWPEKNHPMTCKWVFTMVKCPKDRVVGPRPNGLNGDHEKKFLLFFLTRYAIPQKLQDLPLVETVMRIYNPQQSP